MLSVHLLYYFYPQDSSGEPKVIVYVSLLLKLFTICQLEACGASIDPSNIETYMRGACLTVSGTCNNNHGFKVSMFIDYELLFQILISVVLISFERTGSLYLPCHQRLASCLYSHLWDACRSSKSFYRENKILES